MATTYEELWRKVLLRLDSSEGRAVLFSKEAVNDAHKWVARAKDFDELMVWDTTNAATVIDQEAYHLVDDWALTRPKDVYSIVYYTGDTGSVKLVWKDAQEFDEMYPYPSGGGGSDPEIYTQKGEKVFLQPIPDSVVVCRVYYSQWPLVLVDDDDESSYNDIDDVIIALGYDIAQASLTNIGITDWSKRAATLLSGGIREHSTRPDQRYIANPFRSGRRSVGEYWTNPMVKENL